MSRWLRRGRRLLLGILFLGGACGSADEPEGILILEVAGLKEAQGKVYVAVYDSAATWLSDEAVFRHEVTVDDARDGDFVVTEIVLPVGEYALSAFYDENANGKLDTSFIGIPKEPIALSNNARAKFGAPRYDDAKFYLQLEPVIQRISMQQL